MIKATATSLSNSIIPTSLKTTIPTTNYTTSIRNYTTTIVYGGNVIDNTPLLYLIIAAILGIATIIMILKKRKKPIQPQQPPIIKKTHAKKQAERGNMG